MHDNYRLYMINMYGEKRVKAMKRLTKWSKPKFKMKEVKEFQKYLREQIKIQQKRLGEI